MIPSLRTMCINTMLRNNTRGLPDFPSPYMFDIFDRKELSSILPSHLVVEIMNGHIVSMRKDLSSVVSDLTQNGPNSEKEIMEMRERTDFTHRIKFSQCARFWVRHGFPISDLKLKTLRIFDFLYRAYGMGYSDIPSETQLIFQKVERYWTKLDVYKINDIKNVRPGQPLDLKIETRELSPESESHIEYM